MADRNAAHTRWQDVLFDLLRRHNVTQFISRIPGIGSGLLPDPLPQYAARDAIAGAGGLA